MRVVKGEISEGKGENQSDGEVNSMDGWMYEDEN